MEQKKSIPRSIIFKKAHSGTNGLFYIFDIKFDNGDGGQFFSKTEAQTTFKEGEEAEYTIEKKVNGDYVNYSIKAVKSANGFVPGKGNPQIEHRRTALKCAVDLACNGKVDMKQIIPSAEKFMEFLNS
jgi:hypothetical protein